jgi:hypothetical protein
MSSKYVRNTLEDFLAVNWSDTQVYVVDDEEQISGIPANNIEAWVGIEYLAAVESVNCLPANMWNERGTILLHVVLPNGWKSSHAIEYGDKLQHLLRGQRLENLVIESVSPILSQSPPAIERTSDWQGFCLVMNYQSIKA